MLYSFSMKLVDGDSRVNSCLYTYTMLSCMELAWEFGYSVVTKMLNLMCCEFVELYMWLVEVC